MCPRVHTWSGLNVVPSVLLPLVTPFSTAQDTAPA